VGYYAFVNRGFLSFYFVFFMIFLIDLMTY
jgi:hypothetical protein